MAAPSVAQTAARSLSTTSLWLANAGLTTARNVTKYPKLANITNPTHYDVCIVGGGIFGCTAAYLLKSQGKKVALIEGRNIGGGTTGFSTAKITSSPCFIVSPAITII
jgi:ribulose 1,5-bisphosphate synthetase/thiazole synthase